MGVGVLDGSGGSVELQRQLGSGGMKGSQDFGSDPLSHHLVNSSGLSG